MTIPVISHRRIRFGAFEIDLQTTELARNGLKLPLQRQPFQVLSMLLERSGELVTRDELKSRLWPSDTFVDFDHSLNKAVNRLREVLGDSADQPQYIETLPRLGYRFIGPVATPFQPSASAQDKETTATEPSVPARRTNLKIAAATLGIAVIICAAGWLVWRIAKSRTDAAIQSIAVLPLENLSGDVAQEYFADGMTDQLITDLGQIGSIRVISRTSVMQFKGVHKPLPQIAQELTVDAIVEGTVLRSGDRVRITAQLIQASTDRHLWAETYQGDMRDVISLQNEVARAIADQIRTKFTPQQQAALKNPSVVRPEAYEAYLRGLSQSMTIDGLWRSIAYFQQAVAKEPNYAAAHARLGEAYMWLGHMLALSPQDAFPRAKTEALEALKYDDSLVDAHWLLATTKFLYDWDFPGAEKEFQRAIALNPNSTRAHGLYSDFLIAMGRPDEGIAEIVRSREIDPLSLERIVNVGFAYYWTGRYDLAIEQARRVLAVDPNNYGGLLTLGLCLEQKRQLPAAIEELQKAADLSNDKMWIAFVAQAKAVAGDKVGARKILADLEVLSRQTYISPWCFAIVYPDLGDKDRAFVWLEKSYQGREHDLVFSRVWSMFNSLHSDPRYRALMKRIGLRELPLTREPDAPSSGRS
jgi:TolB-like protein/DNA-binding winged helix-turn-helix (wHTH) protein/Tfp pilus assembly protein PilF